MSISGHAFLLTVPFPAVTIGSDEKINPWGFIEKFLNMLVFFLDDSREKFQESLEQSKELRNHFQFLMDKIFVKVREGLRKSRKDWTVNDYETYFQRYFSKLRKRVSQLKNMARTLAYLELNFKSEHERIFKLMFDQFAESFFSFNFLRIRDFVDMLNVFIENQTKTLNVTTINAEGD